MAYNFTGGGDEDQVFLMPPDPRDWLPEGHLAWAMRRAAAGLDLAPFLAAYATAEQLGLDIAGLEQLLEAEAAAWIEQACAADVAEDALFSGDGGPAGPPPGGRGRKRTAEMLARRQAAQAKLAADARARQEQAEAERAGRIAK